MANDKKFIVKNGLLTPENAVIGSNTDTGEKLQVTGDTVLTQGTQGTPTLKVTNSGGASASTIVAQFEGDSDSLQIRNIGTGDYSITNPQQGNSIEFYDGTAGIVIKYAGSNKLAFTSTGTDFTGLSNTTIEGNRILTTADEGAGNGLDADTVDGLQASQFLRSDVDDTAAGNINFSQDIDVAGSAQVDVNLTVDGQAVIKALLDAQANAQVAGNLTVSGDLLVSGNTTTVNTEEILLADNIITLNSNYTGSTPSEDSGIEIERGTLANPKLVWNESQDYWELQVNGSVLGRIITTADEGSGNGFDADTVDGLEAAQFLRSDADDTATGNITIEGDLTIGDDSGPAQIIFDGNGVNRTLYSATGEIGFLNNAANWAARSNANGDWIVERDVSAGRDVIATNDVTATSGDVTAGDSITAQNNITATTGNIAASAGSVTAQTNVTATTGNVTAGDSVTAQNNVTATTGDVTAGDSVTAQNNVAATTGDVTAGNDVTAAQDITATSGNISATAGSVSAGTTVTAGTDVIGQRFVDADNNTYLVNPGADSTMHAIGIDDNLFHNGDTDTRLQFTDNQIKLRTGGGDRLDINNSRVLSNLDTYVPNLFVNDTIVHNNDTDTLVRFTTDTVDIDTGGSTRLTANNSGVTIEGDLDVNGDITAVNGTFTGDLAASRFLDADNNNYYADPNSTSVMNRIGIDDYIQHNGDTNTYFGFNANDNIQFFTDATQRVEINGTNFTSTVDGIFPNLYAGRFYDLNNATYYVDPASNSRMNGIALVGTIYHDGDTDTYLNFNGANSFEVVTGNAQRLLVNNTYVLANNQMRSPIYYDNNNTAYYGNFASTSQMAQIDIDSYIRHRGDTNTYLGFDANDSITFVTGGAERVNITDANTTFYQPVIVQGDVTADRFVDRQSSSYYVNPADTAVSGTFAGGLRIGNISDYANWDDNTGNGGIGIAGHGAIAAGQNPTITVSGNYSGGYSLLYLNRIDPTSNPTNNGQRYIHFYHDGTDGGSIRGDSSGNLYQVLGSGTNWGFWTSGYSEALIVDDSGNVMVATGTSPTYTDGGDNTALTTTPSNPKLHVGGSIYLNGNNDGIIFGRGTASFLKDEELAFGWGSGWYMQDASYLRVRNNTTVYSTGNTQFNRYYAYQNTAYYLDPDGDSQLNTVDIDDYIRHRGDTNTLIGFSGNDTLLFQTNGVNRLQINNGAFRSRNNTVQFYSSGIEIQKQSNGGGVGLTVSDENSAETPGLTGLQQGSILFYHADGAVTTGSNAAWYFNSSEATVHYVFAENNGANGGNLVPIVNNTGNIGLSSYRWNTVYAGTGNYSGNVTAANMYASRYYDADNNTYYADPASTSYQQYMNINVGNENIGGANSSTLGLMMRGNYNSNTWAHKFHKMDHGGGVPIYLSQTIGTAAWSPLQRWGTFSGSSGASNGGYTSQIFGTLRVDTATYSPIYYDLDDSSWFANPNGESRLNTIKLDGNAVILREPTGTFGSLAVSGGGRNGYEGFSINDRSVFMHDGGNVTGVYNDVDNQWFWYGERGGVMRLMHAGVERARTENGYFLANQQLRTPIFYDSNNTGYYVDPNNTSRFNAVQALRYYFNHATTYYADAASGDYGSMEVGGTKGGWAGYSIAGQWNFMASGVDEAGIYNDTDNKWVIRTDRNAGVDFYYNGAKQAETESGYFLATNQMRAPIYYDSNDSTYYLNPAAGNTNRALMIDGRIYRQGFASGDGNNNKLLETQDRSHWIWNTATDWGIFWAGDDNPYRSHFSTANPNEIVFIGNGNLRASIDLDNGNAHFTGTVSAGSFALNGGNENIEIIKSYGSGGADLVLFDGTEYFDKRVIKAMAPNESPLTTVTSEYVRTTDGPFAGSYVLQTSAYRTFNSDYIPVAPGEELYGEISVKTISGSGGLVYYGIERFDSQKRPIAGNTGTTYFVVGGANYTGTSWTTYRNHTTIPTSHTPYNGSDGGGCYYVRIRILMNYNSGGALRQFAGIMLKRRNAESNLLVDDLQVLDDVQIGGDATIVGDLTVDDITADVIDANIFRDRGNTGYYLDPNSTGTSLNVRGEISNPSVWINDGDNFNSYNENIRLFNAPNGVSVIAFSASGTSGTPATSILGYSDRLETRRSNNWQQRTYSNRVDFVGDIRPTIMYDRNDTNWYADPNSGSRFRELDVENNGSQEVFRAYRYGSAPGNYAAARTINQYGNHSWGIVHEFRIGEPGSQSVPSGTDRPSILFSTGYNTTTWSVGFGYVDNDFRIKQDHGHINQGWGTERFRINTSGEVFIGNSLYGANAYFNRYYDRDNTGYYADPASTSVFNAMVFNGDVDFNGGANAINITSSDIRSDGNSSWTGNPGAGVGKIQMHSNRWYIVSNGNSNRIVQFRQNGSDRSYIANDGRLIGVGGTASQDWRAPIFYDTDDTSYYSNPASDSRYNTLTLRGNRLGFVNTAFDAEIRVTDDNPDGTGATFVFWGDQVEYNAEVATEVFRATRHMRAPVYYDLNNASYYGDFGGVSYMNDVRANIFYERENTAYYFGSSQGDARMRNVRFNNVQIEDGATITSVNNSGRIYLGGNLHIDAQNGTDIFMNYYSGRRFRSFTPGQYEAFRVDTDRIVYAYAQFRTQLIYDTNNTGYYLDMNNNSRFNDLQLRGNYVRTYYHSGSDFVNGTLVRTSIPATATNGASFVLEATGKSYSGDPPFMFTAQGYLYANTIINHSGQHIGKAGFSTMRIFENGGVLCFWWPRVSYWNSFSVHVRNANGDDRNLVTSVSNSSLPGYSKGVTTTMRTTAMYNVNINTGDMYAQRYYDSNDTFYYGDFASSSRMNEVNMYGSGRLQGGAPMYFYTGAGNLRGYIRATDSNDNHFEFATSGGEDFIFRDGGFGGSWNQIIRGNGHVLVASRFDTPIMYDRNDTGYYADPNGTSRFNTMRTNRIYPAYDNAGDMYLDWPSGNYGSIQTNGGGKGGWEGYSINGRYVFMSADNNECGIYNDIDNEWMTIWRRNGRTEIYHNGTWEEYAQPGYMQARGSYRAPVFYDSNDTGYYYDPNSTSAAAGRQRGGTLYGPNTSWGRYLAVGGNGRYSNEASVAATNGNLHLDARSGFGTYINWYVGGTTYINGTLQVNFIYDRDNTAYYWDGGGTSHMNDLRVNILYDRNDTAYYFGSGSGDARANNMRAWEFYADNWFRNYNSGEGLYNQATAMHWYSDSSSRFRLYSTSSTSQILFTTAGNNARGYAYADNSNNIGFLNAGGGWALRTNYSTTEIYGQGYASDFRAYIFYDRNNTGYFCDPTGRSRLAEIDYGNGSYYLRSGSWGWRHQTPSGYIEFGPANGSHAHIYTDRSNFYFNVNEMYMNGRSILKENYWNGSKYFGSDGTIYATIFRDANDGGYYVDPRSTSRINDMETIGRTVIGGTFGNNAYNSTSSTRLHFGGGNGDANANYYIGTNRENYNGNYNKLDLRWHTGIRMGAQQVYGGIRFYDSEDLGSLRVHIEAGSGYTRLNTWTEIGGGGVGIYDGYNGAHFYPNNASSYGSWNLLGSRSGWHGLSFSSGGYRPHLMWENGNGGFYHQDLGRWLLYHNRALNCTGIASSATVSGYRMRINGSLYCDGNVVAYSDVRKKKNIITIDNALDKVLQLRGVYYERIESKVDERDDLYKGRQLGMIAQEVQEIIPEVVSYAKEIDQYGLDYPKMVGLLVEGIKDQHSIVKTQEETINNMQKDIDMLKEMVYNMQSIMENSSNGTN
jgi:hypothetical protein